MSQITEWIIKNQEWLFDGLGVAVLAGAIALIKTTIEKAKKARRISDARNRKSPSEVKSENSQTTTIEQQNSIIRPGDPRRASSMDPRRCSLCKKTENSVEKMVSAGFGFVCNECLPEILETFDHEPDRAMYVNTLCELTYELHDPRLENSKRVALQNKIHGLTLIIGKRGREVAGSVVVGCRLTRQIGSGSFSNVWEAVSLRPQKTFGSGYAAVKIFKQENLGVGLMLWRFQRGIRAMHKFSEFGATMPKSIVRCYEISSDKLSYSMEFFPSGDLQRLAERRLNLKSRLEIFISIAQAVSFAHSHKVIHRDIKPANILLRRDGSAALTDFDISDLSYAQTNSYSHAGLGSPQFAAPEQLIGESTQAHPSADIYSLGKLLFYIIAERAPPIGSTDLTSLPHYLDQIKLPRAKNAIYLALQNDPRERPQSVERLLNEAGLWS